VIALQRYAANFLLLLGFILLAPISPASGQEIGQSTDIKTQTALPTAAAMKECLSTPRSAECLDNLFREALKTHSTLEVLQLIDRFEAQDAELRRDCHPVVHAVGRETFRLKKTIHDSFAACDQTCHSGCYHGSVERFLRGDDIYARTNQHPSQRELKQKAGLRL